MRIDDIQIKDLEKRKVVLIGDEEICKYFYLQFSSILRIKYIFATNIDQTGKSVDGFFEGNQNVECIPFSDSLIEEYDLLLILCVEHAFREPYDTMLFHKGFEWGRDYIDYMYVIQYYRHLYHVNLKRKNIWIFGAGNNGSFFYERYKQAYHICGFVSNYEKEKEYLGLPVIRPESLLEQDDFYIVICSDAAVDMAEKLCGLGLRGSHEYGFEINLPKDFFIGAGTCQIIKVGEFLRKNKSFTDQYYVALYFDNIYDPCSDADNKRLKAYGRFCDAVLYSITGIGSVEFRNFAPLVDRYYQKAEKFHMPFYYFKGQMTQSTDDVNPYALRPREQGYFWFRGDQEVNRMLEDGETPEIVIEKVCGEHYWTDEEILENFRREMKKVEVLDRFSSFSILPFIEENYRKMLVFIDGTHFGYQLCIYLANQIAQRLCIEQMDVSEMEREGECPVTSVMPVYPCVKQALGMKVKERYQFYNIKESELCYLDFREYMKIYVEYVLCARKINEKLGTIMAW